MGLVLARDLQQRALAVETGEEAARLAKTFHQVTRGLRQTLALDARLKREQQALLREAARERELAKMQAVERRRAEVHGRVAGIIWDEFEGEERQDLLEELFALVREEAQLDGFLDEPVDQQAARIRDLLLEAVPDDAGEASAGETPAGETPAGETSDADGAEAPPPPNSS